MSSYQKIARRKGKWKQFSRITAQKQSNIYLVKPKIKNIGINAQVISIFNWIY